MGTILEGAGLNPIVVSILVLSVTLAIVYLFWGWAWLSLSVSSAGQSKPTKISALPQQDRGIQVSKASDAPDGWYTDAKTFEIERHAIFSQVSSW